MATSADRTKSLQELHAMIKKGDNRSAQEKASFAADVRAALEGAIHKYDFLLGPSGTQKTGPALPLLVAIYGTDAEKIELLPYFLDKSRDVASMTGGTTGNRAISMIVGRHGSDDVLKAVLPRYLRCTLRSQEDANGYTDLMHLVENQKASPGVVLDLLSRGLALDATGISVNKLGILLAQKAAPKNMAMILPHLIDAGLSASYTSSSATGKPRTIADILSVRPDRAEMSPSISTLRALEAEEKSAKAKFTQAPWWKRAAQACARAIKAFALSKKDPVDTMLVAIRTNNPESVERAARDLHRPALSIAKTFADKAGKSKAQKALEAAQNKPAAKAFANQS